MIKAFLSHSSKDKNLVAQVYNELGDDYSIYDERTFESGLPILAEIDSWLSKTDIFVIFLSNDSLNSDWVKRELFIAQELLNSDQIKRFRPYIIDQNIEINDQRIPKWLTGNIISKNSNPILLARRIKKDIIELIYSEIPQLKEKEEAFVGRNSETEELEQKFHANFSVKKKCIIVSGLEGVGRRTFLKRSVPDKLLNERNTFAPIILYLDRRESIEDLILQLNDLVRFRTDEYILQILQDNKQDKLDLAVELIEAIVKNNDIIFIKERASIVLPNRQITEWFIELLRHHKFPKQLCLFVISSTIPVSSIERILPELITIHLSPLSKPDRLKLFNKYANICKLEIEDNDIDFFVNIFTGQPEQIFLAVDYIKKDGVEFAKRQIKEIIDIGDKQAIALMSIFKDDARAIELLTLLAKFEFISYETLYHITGEKEATSAYLEKFFAFAMFEHIGNYYIRLNGALSDYITRTRLKLSDQHQRNLKSVAKNLLAKENVDKLKDLSVFLYTVKDTLMKGNTLSAKYFIPSFALHTITKLYYRTKYREAIKLCDKLLYDNNKYYDEIIREGRYWLCLCLCREKDERFFKEVKYFSNDSDFEFLMGFYYRIQKNYERALMYYQSALKKDKKVAKVKRELVTVFLGMSKFEDALELAKENYNKDKTANPFHIEAYFKCLLRKRGPNTTDKETLIRLMDEMGKSYDKHATTIKKTMHEEFRFYIDKQIPEAIKNLRLIIEESEYKKYPIRSLSEIYDKTGNHNASKELKLKYPTVSIDYSDD